MAHVVHDVGERTGELEPLGTAWPLATQRLLAGLVDAERAAALTGIRTARIARLGGFELAIGGEQCACDQANSAEQLHHRGHGLVDGRGTDAGAEVAQGTLARDRRIETGQLPVATPLLRLGQIVTEAGLIDVLIHFGGHFQHDQAGRVVAVPASGAIVGRTDRAGEAHVNRGPNEPTEAAFDVPLTRQRNGTRCKRLVRAPTARGLGEKRGEGLAHVLVAGVSVGDKRLKITGRELLMGKRYAVSAPSGSSSSKKDAV